MEQEVWITSTLTGKVVQLTIKDFSKSTANHIAEIITEQFVNTSDVRKYIWHQDTVLSFNYVNPTLSFYCMLEASTNSYLALGYHSVT